MARHNPAAAQPFRLAPTDDRATVSVSVDLGEIVDLVAERVEQRVVARLGALDTTDQLKKKALRVPDVAVMLSISEREVWELLSSGELASITVGRIRLVPLSVIDTFLAGRLGAQRAD